MHFQSSLFDGAVRTTPGVRPLDGAERTTLTRGAWVDVLRNFVVGADDVLERLVADVPGGPSGDRCTTGLSTSPG